MHTIKVFVLQKFTVVVFKYFLIPENVTKINSFKMPNQNNRHLKWYFKDRFSVPKHYMGRERCFVFVFY